MSRRTARVRGLTAAASQPAPARSPEWLEAAQELACELREIGVFWSDATNSALGVEKRPRLLFEALVAERLENTSLMQWVDDLQSGMYVNCVYCGHRYGPRDSVPVTKAAALRRHIRECPKHPMSELLQVLEAGRKLLGSAAYVPGDEKRRAVAEVEFAALDNWLTAVGAAIARAKGTSTEKTL